LTRNNHTGRKYDPKFAVAMALTMGLPDDLHLYLPVFHLHALWLAGVGIVILRSGVRMELGDV